MAAEAKDYFRTHLDTYLQRLETIVNMDSGTVDPDDVAAVSAHFSAWMKQLSGKVEVLRPNAAYGPFLIGRWQGHGQGRVLLVGHLDTVYSRGEAARRPFTLSGGRASGCGVIDMKSGCLLALTAIQAMRDLGREFGELVLALTPDEEVGSPVSQPLLAQLALDQDAILVLEPGRAGGGVVVGRKGVADYTIRAFGHASHAGVAPQEGHSAVLELCHQALALANLNGQEDGLQFNVGVFHGGSRPNVVPGEAQMVVDVRAASDAAVKRAVQLFSSLRAKTPGVRLEVDGGFAMPPMETTDQIQALFALAQRQALTIGEQLTAVSTGGGSDANHLAVSGKPVLDGLGPVGGGAHSPEEFMEVDSVVTRGAILTALLSQIGAHGRAAFATT
ncbi:MAG: M20/M25/M40 family metallo-hydrolase [Sulfobacillus sp.]